MRRSKRRRPAPNRMRRRRGCVDLIGSALAILIAGWLLLELLRLIVNTARTYWWVIVLVLLAAWLAPKAPAVLRSLWGAKEKMKNDWLYAEKRKRDP